MSGNTSIEQSNNSLEITNEDKWFYETFSKLILVLRDDPRMRILSALATDTDGNSYMSFRTIAKRTGINYNSLKQYLSQLEAIGLVEKITLSINGSKSRKGYNYYRLRDQIRHVIEKVIRSSAPKYQKIFLPIAINLLLLSLYIAL